MTRRLWLLTLLVLLAGCSGQPPVPEDHYYRLPEAPGAAEPRTLTDGTVFVERFIADGIYRERALAYANRSAPTDVMQRHYQHWIESPAVLLQGQLMAYLRARQAGPMITDAPSVPASLSIYGRIEQFDQIVSGDTAQVVVVLEFRVEKQGKDTPLLVRRFEQTVNAGDASMESAITAFGKAVNSIFDKLAEGIATAG